MQLIDKCRRAINNAVDAGLTFEDWSVLDLCADDESMRNESLYDIKQALIKLGYWQYKDRR